MQLSDFDGIPLTLWSSRRSDCPVRPQKIIVYDLGDNNILWLDDVSPSGGSEYWAYVRFPNQTTLVVKEVEA